MNDEIACINMCKQQLRTNNVRNPKILSLYSECPRHQAVPTTYRAFTYADMHIPLAHGQRMMTPLEEATLLQALDLQGHENILEIGTGTGYLTALLSRLSHHVLSLDYFAEFTQNAGDYLKTIGATNTTCLTVDGSMGWPDQAPYDVIIFTSATTHIDETIRLQVAPEGKLFTITGADPLSYGLLHTLDHQEQWQQQRLFSTNLPSLIEPNADRPFIF